MGFEIIFRESFFELSAVLSYMTNSEPKDTEQSGDAGSMRVPRAAVTLREQATDILRQAIIDQRFLPGEHLVERELCELLGVSRTSVREALRHLESENLIQMIPHKGPVVASLGFEEARNIYEVRAALEGLAGELFAKKATQAQIDRLCRIANEIMAAANDPNPQTVLEIKSRFYQALFEGAQNDECARVIQSLNTRVWLLRRMSLVSPGRSKTMMHEVNRITNAAKARDATEMRAACMAHVESASHIVLPQLQQSEEEAAQ
jgi:GntR family transcriptional regulator, trigonelline degradation regulator